MEYSIKKNIDGKEYVIELTSEECREIYQQQEIEYRSVDVENYFESYAGEYNYVNETKDILMTQVLAEYIEKYGDSDYGSWADCLDYAYKEALTDKHRAIIHTKEQGHDRYFYGHYASLESSVPLRILHGKGSLEEKIANCTFEDGQKTFIEISGDSAFDIYQSFGAKSNLYGSLITINADDNTYKYKSLVGGRSYRVDLNHILEVAKSIDIEKDMREIDAEFYLKTQMLLDKEYTRCVLVEPGLAATTYYMHNDLENKQYAVQGLIEAFYHLEDDEVVSFCNEEGRIYNMNPNRRFMGYDTIVGPFIILGEGEEGDTVGLTDEQTQKYMERFRVPDRFTDKERDEALEIHSGFIELDDSTFEQLLNSFINNDKGRGR